MNGIEKKQRGVRRSLARDNRGLSTVEYIILLALVAVAAISAWTQFGEALIVKLGDKQAELEGI